MSRNTSPRAPWQGPRLGGVTASQAILIGREMGKNKIKGGIWIINGSPYASGLGNPQLPHHHSCGCLFPVHIPVLPGRAPSTGSAHPAQTGAG